MFRVITTTGVSEEYERWIDALDAAKARIPECKGWFGEVRILENDNPVWSFTRSNKYPVFLGPGTYNRLARQFLQETMEQEASENSTNDDGVDDSEVSKD